MVLVGLFYLFFSSLIRLEPETEIVGGPDVYINTGSRLALTCSVKYSPEPPAFIFWYHNEKVSDSLPLSDQYVYITTMTTTIATFSLCSDEPTNP